jgi:SPP1 family predicted phage head-tail adaptor
MSAKKSEIGKMRRRLVIEAPIDTADGQGGFTTVWTEVATVWGEVKTKSRSERWFSDQVQQIGDHEIMIRWLPSLVETMRLRLNEYDVERTFQIKGIEWVDDRRYFVSLTCLENVGS